VLAVRDEVAKLVVGQEGVLSGLVAALLVRGHVLLEGVPGVAKTLLVKALAASLDLRTTRVQFTPDLMPSDVLGQTILDPSAGPGGFRFREGPVFTNLLLADEINRTPPRTQSALLEAMEERQVSSDGVTRPLPDPFVVVATQNPIEYEGTYPLPEAQLDRFLFKLVVGYPSAEQEQAILQRHDAGQVPHDVSQSAVRAVAGPAELAAARAEVEAIRCEPQVLAYIVALVRATRDSPSLTLGVSPPGRPPCCCGRRRRGRGSRAGTSSRPTTSRPWPARRCATGSRSDPRSSSRAARPDGVLDGCWPPCPVPR
jgi:MoxR-like ATPase